MCPPSTVSCEADVLPLLLQSTRPGYIRARVRDLRCDSPLYKRPMGSIDDVVSCVEVVMLPRSKVSKLAKAKSRQLPRDEQFPSMSHRPLRRGPRLIAICSDCPGPKGKPIDTQTEIPACPAYIKSSSIVKCSSDSRPNGSSSTCRIRRRKQ